jgi:hypothetical protein
LFIHDAGARMLFTGLMMSGVLWLTAAVLLLQMPRARRN